MKKFIVTAFLITLVSPAHAIDPGFARGSLHVGTEVIPLTHAYAQLHDNAESLLDFPKEMRILVADREVRQDTLNGLVFLPVRSRAKEGTVRGLLITFDPKDASRVQVTFLTRPSDPDAMLITQSRTTTNGVIRNLKVSPQWVSGEIEDRDKVGGSFGGAPVGPYTVSFGAPLFHEPKVTEEIKGPAIQKSSQVKLLRAAAEAMTKGDFEALRKLSTERANRQTDLMLAETGPMGRELAKGAGKEMADSMPRIERIVVRGDSAAVIYQDRSWKNLKRVGGDWKIDE